MSRRKLIALIAVMTLGGILLAPTVMAEETPRDKPISTQSEADKEAVEKQRKEAIEKQKEELRERVKTAREAVKTKLADARLDICKKRAGTINRIATKSTEQASKHLVTFQKIEQRVKEFYVSKNLTAANYDALVATIDEKEAAAVAAIAVAGETTFNCETTDSTEPGKVVRDLNKSKHDALKEYRLAIKNLIVAVKQATGENE